MKHTKRFFAVLIAAVMMIGLMPIINVDMKASAVSLFDQRVSQLRTMFPNNGYWNHAVYSDSQRGDVLLANWDNTYGDYTSGTPCATHNGQPGYGQFDCNAFDGGIQCWGFANRIFYGIFGVYASTVSQRWDTQNISKGDWIRMSNETHSAVVLSRNGDYLTIVEGNRDGNCKIVWDRQIHISSVNWFKHAPNWESIVNPISYIDLGKDFYAFIEASAASIHLENVNENVQLTAKNDNNDPKQIWHFLRQSDGSYKIINEYDGKCLDLSNGNPANDTNIGVYTDNGTTAQRWFIINNGSSYGIKTACGETLMDVHGAVYSAGTNIKVYQYNGSHAQCFTIYKISYTKPEKPAAPTITVSTLGQPNETTTVSWTASPLKSSTLDNRTYTLTLTQNGVSASKTGLTGTSFDLTLSKGTYTVKIRAVNTKYKNYYTDGNSLTFTVKDCIHSWNAGAVTTPATCTSSGIKTYTCNSCGATRTEAIDKANHQTIIINARAATVDAEGYSGDEYCTVCQQTISYGHATPKLDPSEQPQSVCPWCGGEHIGFFQGIIGWFHGILAAIFGARY